MIKKIITIYHQNHNFYHKVHRKNFEHIIDFKFFFSIVNIFNDKQMPVHCNHFGFKQKHSIQFSVSNHEYSLSTHILL